MPITPPLDRIPVIPSKLVSLINKQISTQISVLADSVSNTVQNSIKLPESARCDDPAVQRLKRQLESLVSQIQQLNNIIPIVNQAQSVLSAASNTAAAIKAAQLLNPATAPAIIAAELLLVQNMTIANSIQAAQQLQSIPTQLEDTLKSLAVDIALALQNFSNVCNNESFQFPGSVIDELNNLNGNFDDALDSEFYQTKNVQQEDIDERNDLIQQLIDTQTDLLTSLQEAPSQVFTQTGVPSPELGKPGDYYVDNVNKIIYGPKLSNTEWPEGVNY